MPDNKFTKQADRLPVGKVYLVGAGPGDPGLFTLRGLECLHKADVVVHDRLIGPELLSYAPQARLVDVGKESGHHAIPQQEINQILVNAAREGKVVTRLKGGDPFVFGRGGEEAMALAEAGIPFEIVPGVTSAIAVPAYAGIPVTQRGIACSVAFITGHNASSETLNINWQALANGVDTLVFLMGVHNLQKITSSLVEAGRAPSTPVALIERGTLANQRVITGTLAEIAEKSQGIQPPAIIIVGDVVNLHPILDWFQKDVEKSIPG